MAPTTRKKNRISYEELDEDAFDFDWEEDESGGDFADVDKVKPPAKKKQKLAKAKDAPAAKPPFEMLPQEVLTHMMLFLDSAKDVYALSMVGSRHIRGAITIQKLPYVPLFLQEESSRHESRVSSTKESKRKLSIYPIPFACCA